MSKQSKAWAESVLALYGPWCIACGSPQVELDHIFPKGQGGTYDPGNGAPLCGPWSGSIPGGHHKAKTEGRWKYSPSLLLPVTLDFLEAAGWVAFDEQGQPYGRGWRHFEPVTVGLQMEGGRR